jgi:Zn-dependent protease with chaperone function
VSPSFAVLCLAAFAAVSYFVSALVAAALATGRRALVELAAPAQARLLLAVALLPLLASAAVMTAVLAPALGWMADHCTAVGHSHGHAHICAAHHVAGATPAMLAILALFLAARVVHALARLGHAAVVGVITRRALDRAAGTGADRGLRVLALEEPRGFVLGLVRPTLYVTRGLLRGESREHLAPVLAHERAHLRRRDPLWRAVANVGLGFHLPCVARWIGGELERAQEMAADAEAASVVGSGARVARALVHLARAQARPGPAVLAFGAADVEARVLRLLDDRPRRDWPGGLALALLAVASLVLVGVGAPLVHHGVEHLVGALGS